MKLFVVSALSALVLLSCKNESETSEANIERNAIVTAEKETDMIVKEVFVEPIKKSRKQIKEELHSKGYKTYDYVDEKTKDTILMQQYFMAFLKSGPIRVQNEEESADLQQAHLNHLTKMYEMGYADISGPFGDDGSIRGVTIYNVPTLKMADSLAKADPMVQAGRLEIEIHPWWAAKGFSLR